MEEHYINLIHKKLANEVSIAEREELELWLTQKQANKTLADEIETLWKQSQLLGQQIDESYQPNTEIEFAKLQSILKLKTTKEAKVVSMKRRNILQIAAAVLVLIAAGWWWFNSQNTVEWETTLAQNEIIRDVALPDGTKIWLNKNAKLSFPKKFDIKSRIVRLEGEAYFEVAHDPSKPFIIEGANTSVQVLGTKFNYKALKTKDLPEVQVLEGKVQFSTEEKKQAVILATNQRGILENGQLTKANVMAVNAIAWHTGRFVFEGTKITEALRLFEQYYEVKIDYSKSEIKDCLLTADFDQDDLETIFETLKILYQLEIKNLTNNTIELSKGTCQ